ncbi:MAG: hypothetical protein DRP87_08405 [Spirochaetes bacterium]|nr:MAG: hypothetical protein DRP87_08405 [Spirochaetota bacterium]
METLVYIVPSIDVSWDGFGPLNPGKNYSVTPPPLDECLKDAELIVELLKELHEGKSALTIFSGTYCRNEFMRPPFTEIWNRIEKQGGEILLHTHEETAGNGTHHGEESHMKSVIRYQFDFLKEIGLHPVGYRGGLYAYCSFLTPLLEELGIPIDLSSAPGCNKPEREAVWDNIPYSAFFLSRNDPNRLPCEEEKSQVFEIPLGADGEGGENINFLYIDYVDSDLENSKRIYDVVLSRARNENCPQIIYTLFHTFSAHKPRMIERYKQFVDYTQKNGAQAVNPTEARKIYESISS